MNTAVLGSGWVGQSMIELFPDSFVYDEPHLLEKKITGKMGVEMGRIAVNNCDVSFVCVPTPNLPDGSLDTSIVEDVVSWCESDLIVIRSTVNPGTTDKLKAGGKHVVFQPEYLGETPQHPMLHPAERPFMVIGGEPDDRRKLINLYTGVYNANISIRQVSALEAEVIKLSENRAIAFKVAECQELYDVCMAAGMDYYTIRDAVYGDDPRFNLWFSFIYTEHRGMDSKCIPKDVYAWAAWAASLGYEAEITDVILDKNQEWVHG